MLYKLELPSQLVAYDLAAFLDSDAVLNPAAPCLSTFADALPSGGFGAVQTVSFTERSLFPEWAPSYYDEFRAEGLDRVPRPDLQMNGGLYLYRPHEVARRWRELLDLDTSMNEENRLCVYELQEGRCLFLPLAWNTVWLSERRRLGIEPATRVGRVLNRLTGHVRERAALHDALLRSHMLHLAFEHSKVAWIDVRRLLRASAMGDQSRTGRRLGVTDPERRDFTRTERTGHRS